MSVTKAKEEQTVGRKRGRPAKGEVPQKVVENKQEKPKPPKVEKAVQPTINSEFIHFGTYYVRPRAIDAYYLVPKTEKGVETVALLVTLAMRVLTLDLDDAMDFAQIVGNDDLFSVLDAARTQYKEDLIKRADELAKLPPKPAVGHYGHMGYGTYNGQHHYSDELADEFPEYTSRPYQQAHGNDLVTEKPTIAELEAQEKPLETLIVKRAGEEDKSDDAFANESGDS